MLPIVIFPQITICGTKENALKFENDHVSFKAMSNTPQNGIRSIYSFIAFDDEAERIKRMKVTAKSEVTIVALMKEYVDTCNVRRQSFTVVSIDFVRTNSIMKPSEDVIEKLLNKETPVINENKPEQENSKIYVVPENKREVNPDPDSIIDLDEFERCFGT